MEGEEADQAPRGCSRQRHQHDFLDHSYVILPLPRLLNPCGLFFLKKKKPYSVIILTSILYSAPKDQVSRAAKMLAEEYVFLLPKHTHVAVAVAVLP